MKSPVLRGLVVLVTAASVVAGCGAGPEPSAPAGSPYPSVLSTRPTRPTPSPFSRPPPSPTTPHLPTLTEPTGPPRDPTDQIKKTNIIVGTVTRGGSGPCYGLQTDDGVEYALYSSRGETLTRGTRVTVRTRSTSRRIDCGPGRLVEIAAIVR